MKSTARSVLFSLAAFALGASLGSCALTHSARQGDAASNTPAAAARRGSTEAAEQKPAPRYLAAGVGRDYEWGKDHLFVKLSSAQTGGLLTLIEDNLKPGFDLGLHLHRRHTEIFYILDGEVEFIIGDKSITATKGAVIYVPPGTPHAAKSPKGAKMLMFYTPGGFDEMLAEISQSSLIQRINPIANARLNEKYDHVDLK